MDKTTLRKHFKDIRLNTDPVQRQSADKIIAEKFLALEDYKQCSALLAYVSSDIEVSTKAIIEKAFEEKKVYCPKCVKGTNIMYFYRVHNFSQLEKGSFGISEPVNGCEKCEVFNENALCIVPALSYDKNGFRLGFGKGFYDRFLSGFKGIKIGICYESCLSEIILTDKYDVNVNKLVTENNVYTFSTPERMIK